MPNYPKNNKPATLVVFDSAITRTSPAGSCLLKVLESLAGKWPIHTIVNRTDLPNSPLLTQTSVPAPARPVFARTILFAIFGAVAYWLRVRRPRDIRIATESAYPFCQISYAHFCHRYFLLHHPDTLGTGTRRVARLINHRWCAWLEPIAFRHARRIIVPSQGIAREIDSTYSELTRGKIQVIPNPVDTKRFQREPSFCPSVVHQQLGIPSGAFVLSFCALGGFTRKGLSLVFEAMAELREAAIHLIIAGGSISEVSEFQSRAKQLKIHSNVHFAGLQQDIRAYLWASQVYVFPSAYEGFPLVCLQAAAAGLPLISTLVNGVEDFLQPGMNGWLVERTAESVAAAIASAAADPEKTARMGETAQKQVQAYRTEIFQARWLELLANEFGIRADTIPEQQRTKAAIRTAKES